jgi:hypothetical protein
MVTSTSVPTGTTTQSPTSTNDQQQHPRESVVTPDIAPDDDGRPPPLAGHWVSPTDDGPALSPNQQFEVGIQLKHTNKKQHKRLAIREKLSILKKVEHLQAVGYSQRAAATAVHDDNTQIIRWKKDVDKYESSEREDIKSFTPGKESSIADIEAALLWWVFQQREREREVSVFQQ